MYIPKQFRVEDMEEVKRFLQEHAFATIVSSTSGRPVATHLPLQVAEKNGKLTLTGHFAYGNKQWKAWSEEEEVLVIFQGPHAYVSSSWYDHVNVPTWNYEAVHIYGIAHFLSLDELKNDLAALLEKYEHGRESAVVWNTLPEELLERELKGIKGFRIDVTKVEAAYKLSQNRHPSDYEAIQQHLLREDSEQKSSSR
ncbi:FMN-binding negative transcriptional regulator [Paenisporosarcina cavernae]|uniref:FMN-binding negative transcriptional regulator n=1 Tax=Paenisporosarcina cavernae TaxID=2320858 RepID=A0A385YU48_9BACL|nr:FMN-binding negative transcriptional regulator [Paenisporosarcina cavernae]AYC29003.1 FMN-binding negative transcriptional regulator [Paenisporosarcina cavernae]